MASEVTFLQTSFINLYISTQSKQVIENRVQMYNKHARKYLSRVETFYRP